MGLNQSAPFKEEEEEEEEEEDEDHEEEDDDLEQDADDAQTNTAHRKNGQEGKFELKESNKVDIEDELEQDPEIVPFESSASPASSVTTPHLSPAVRIWDPGHVLSPLSLSHHGRSFNSREHAPPSAVVGDEVCTEVYLIRHGESNMNTLPELIGGRSPSAMLTAEGKRQARALGVFLLSHGLHFDAVFSSPIERCKQTAFSVCQEVNFDQEKIEFSDALAELSQGLWEGLRRSEIYSPELRNVIMNSQPDFRAPGGESQRQVEYRMIEFFNNVIIPKAVEANLQKDSRLFYRKQSKSNTLMQVHPLDGTDDEGKSSDILLASGTHSSFPSKGIPKSRLHRTSSGATSMMADGSRPQALSDGRDHKAPSKPTPYFVAVFSHGLAIKCLLRGILGSDPHMTHRLCIDNSSLTVLKHSTHHGWQVQRVNDTAHLRLL